jgi:hypothetical protein
MWLQFLIIEIEHHLPAGVVQMNGTSMTLNGCLNPVRPEGSREITSLSRKFSPGQFPAIA